MTAIRQKIGRVGLRTRGTWTDRPSEPYMTLDVVEKDGGSYMSKVDNNTSMPPSASWQIVSQRGETGYGVPIGGTTGQVLKKKSNEDFDTEWSSDDAPVTSVNNKTGNVTLNANDVNALPSSTIYGSAINISMDSTTYVLTLSLIGQNGVELNAKSVDLPIESVVVNGRYDAINKKIVLTLQSGSTIDVPVGDLVAGLQTEITSVNMLDADLVDDTNSTHKFVTAQEKTNWNNKSDFSGNYNDLINKPTIPVVPTNISEFNNDVGYLTEHQDISGKQDALVSGTNIKTINNESILGSGNIAIQGEGSAYVPTLNAAPTSSTTTYTKDGQTVDFKIGQFARVAKQGGGYDFYQLYNLTTSNNVTMATWMPDVHDVIGDINTILDTINGEVI